MNCSNYTISSSGCVWSCSDEARRGKRWFQLRVGVGPYGHLRVSLIDDFGAKRAMSVHRLVLLAFAGPCPKGMECRHLDGNPQNNNFSNLCWGTHQENMDDRVRHGTLACGDRMGSYRHDITEELLLEAFARLKSSVQVSKELQLDRSSLRTRLRRYGYRIVRNRAKIGYGWENYLAKVCCK